MAIFSHNSYKEATDYDVQFWHTKDMNKVDFILQDEEIAIEVKVINLLDKISLKSKIIFMRKTKQIIQFLPVMENFLKRNHTLAILHARTMER